MTDCIYTFFSAWGDPSEETRKSASGDSLAATFYYSDPNTPAPLTNMDDYLSYLKMFGEMAPGAVAKVVHIDARHGHARVNVDFVITENMSKRGQYFVDFSDGKITRMIGFAGTGEPN